jgi:hypothetical protein
MFRRSLQLDLFNHEDKDPATLTQVLTEVSHNVAVAWTVPLQLTQC